MALRRRALSGCDDGRRSLKARALAFYLPQFFPIPENDEWWGPGFTEWTNAARARPLFRGHQQPTLPADLGFYDLRVPETRHAQGELARRYGVEAFVYWHYWFGGGDRILDRPFREVLASGEPDVGFALAWANQTWTGTWHGAPDRVLKQQTLPRTRGRRRALRDPPPGVPRRALPPRARQAGVLRLPARGAARCAPRSSTAGRRWRAARGSTGSTSSPR